MHLRVGRNLMKDFISCDKSFPLENQIYRMKCRFNESTLSKYDITTVDVMDVTGNDFRILIKYRIIRAIRKYFVAMSHDLIFQ